VALPPGRAKLLTSFDPTGSLAMNTIGIVVVACCAAPISDATKTSTLSASRLGSERLEPFGYFIGEANFQLNRSAIEVAEILQSLLEPA
jgi:hypothetical protein